MKATVQWIDDWSRVHGLALHADVSHAGVMCWEQRDLWTCRTLHRIQVSGFHSRNDLLVLELCSMRTNIGNCVCGNKSSRVLHLVNDESWKMEGVGMRNEHLNVKWCGPRCSSLFASLFVFERLFRTTSVWLEHVLVCGTCNYMAAEARSTAATTDWKVVQQLKKLVLSWTTSRSRLRLTSRWTIVKFIIASFSLVVAMFPVWNLGRLTLW